MLDQKARFIPSGITAEFLGELQQDEHAVKRVREGEHQLVFVTPENLFHGQAVRGLLASHTFREKIVAFIVDEAHCILKW